MKTVQSVRNLDLVDWKNRFSVYGLITTFLYVAYHKILDGQFWMLDDHVMVKAFEQTKSLNFIPRIDTLLELCSVNYFPDDGRLNPTLSLFYAIRVFFFGTNASLYFVVNFLILVLTNTALYNLLVSIRMSFLQSKIQTIERLTLVVFSTCLFSIPQFVSNYATLGTSELIGPLFLFIVLDLMIKRTIFNQRTIVNGILLMVGTFLLAGIKENYAIALLVMQISIFFLGRGQSKLDIKLEIFLISITLFFVIQIFYVSQSLGTDVYGKQTGLLFTVMATFKFFSSKFGITITVIFALTSILINLKRNQLTRYTKALISLPYLISLSDWMVYRGDIRDRYATNTIVSLFLATYILFILVMLANRKRQGLPVVILIACLMVIISELPSGVSVVERKIQATDRFERGLETIKYTSSNDKSLPVVFIAQSDWDYESIISVAIFMKSKGLENSLVLELSREFPEDSKNISIFKAWSEEGVAGLYAPKNAKDIEFVTCVYSQSSPEKRLKNCRNTVVLKWLP